MVEQLRAYARACGVIYVLIFVAAIFGEVFAARLVDSSNAAVIAVNVVKSEATWRLGYSAQAFTMLCDVTVSWLLYVLLAPVNRNLALLAAFFRLTYVAAYAPAVIANVAVLRLAQQHNSAAALFAVRMHDTAFAASLIFFGANLLIAGYLIARAPIAVAWLSVALQAAGVCYIVNTFTIFMAPAIHALISPWILLPPFVGELSLTFWLLFTRKFDAIPVENLISAS